MSSQTDLSDDEIRRLEDAIALTLDIGEMLKRAIYHCEDLETLGHLGGIVKATVQLRSILIAWRSGGDPADYRQYNQPATVDELDRLIDLTGAVWQGLANLKGAIVSKKPGG